MKICPQCQNTYTDDELLFCLQDGTQLSSVVSAGTQMPTVAWGEPETLIKSDRNQMRINLQEPPNTQRQNFATDPQTDFQTALPPPKSKLWLLLLLGLFVLLAITGLGGAGVWYYFNSAQPNVVQNNTNSNTVPSNANISGNTDVNSTPTATPTAKPTLKPAEIEAAKKEAESVIYGWKSAAENHNLDTNLSNYADTVDYYKGGKISRSKIRASKEPAYKKYDTIDIEISAMKVLTDPTGEKATVTFDKTWDFAGVDKDGNDVVNQGSVQQQLILNKINGKWKIVSEKDMKVYYVSKGDDGNN